MSEPLICVICSRRETRAGMVCDIDRTRVARALDEIVELYATLTDTYQKLVEADWPDRYEYTDHAGEVHRGVRADPIAALLPAASVSRKTDVPISGSRTPPLPIAADILDLTMPARAAAVSDGLVPQFETVTVEVRSYLPTVPDVPEYSMVTLTLRQRQARRDGDGLVVFGPSGDQVGHLSVASILDSWVRDWRDVRGMDEGAPLPTVVTLARWLSVRLDWACGHHGAVDEFATEMSDLVRTLRRICGTTEVKPELLDAECSRCDQRAMYRLPGEDRVECGGCGRRLTEDEYRVWCGLLVADLKERVA